ncbi:SDR family oxidoreductase [Coralloluteibacterium stylophorae]|uniref:SDR family oxidoreductase n=1 Tax=Coralloluteibacterium stylophorae TaxID=1776034 RepID=A0A8J7VV47_9GAMM|nr:SDR family oxidoreductase [Coralloluteibacterium stylophorae]MBS7456466.1 SDR family oxidoreductase [Coralloluteibacterium stylophorae]
MPSKPPEVPVVSAAPLAGRVVLVTGSAHGIGRAICEGVLAAGGSVVALDQDGEAGRRTAQDWSAGERVLFRRTDVAREAQVAAAVAAALKRFGRLDGVVNNANIADPVTGPVAKLDLADWNRRLAINLTAAMLFARHAAEALGRDRGAIVNIASTRAHQSEPETEAYAACKGGLLALTHALAISLGPTVRVNAISPGWIDTGDYAALRRADHAHHPVGRVGVPADIAALCVFLLSDAAGFVTGQEFVADGGMTRKMIYAG